MICGGQVSIPHWPAKTFQPGDAWRQLLTPMGARIYRSPEGSLVCQGSGVIGGTQCDLEAVGGINSHLGCPLYLSGGAFKTDRDRAFARTRD